MEGSCVSALIQDRETKKLRQWKFEVVQYVSTHSDIDKPEAETSELFEFKSFEPKTELKLVDDGKYFIFSFSTDKDHKDTYCLEDYAEAEN